MDEHEVHATHLKFEGVERRSEAYGISNALTGPLRERNGALMAMASRRLTERNQHSSVARTTTAQMTALNMDSKENVDMAFELNVPSGMDVQVQIEVKDDDGNVISLSPLKRLPLDHRATSSAVCMRLQRMNAIESLSKNHSSAKHRTESHSIQNCNDSASSSASPAEQMESGKRLTWHQSVMDALESHEFRHRDAHKNKATSETRQLNNGKERNTTATTVSSKSEVEITEGFVAGRTAIFDHRTDDDDSASNQQDIDPAELSLKERFELFEKNKGTALIPKAALGIAPSAKQIANSHASGSDTRHIATQSESQIGRDVQNAREQEMGIRLKVLNCIENHESNDTKRPIPPPPPMPKPNNGDRTTKANQKRQSDESLSVSHNVCNAIEDVKRMKIGYKYPSLSHTHSDDVKHVENNASANESSIYPSLLDVELDTEYGALDVFGTDTKTEDDDLLFSSRPGTRDFEDDDDALSEHTCAESETHSSKDDELFDDHLDEGDDDDDDDDYNLNTHDKRVSASVSSSSFSFGRPRLEALRQHAIAEVKSMGLQSRLTVNPMDVQNSESLAHTVDSYRRQQSIIATPVLPKAVRQNDDDLDTSTDSEACDDKKRARDDHIRSHVDVVNAKIKKLMEIVTIQQQQMVQASNALNTCASTFAFSGSTESVVAEWKLLIATHSRQAAQNEVNRLRAERFLRPVNALTECGRLTIKEIALPLEQEYVTKFENDQIAGKHLLCLLKYNEQLVATKTVLTSPGLLSAKFHDVLQMNNVYADFKVTLEIYGMDAKHEVLPHDVKYRIKKKKKGLLRTPKSKKDESRAIMSPPLSPVGPNVVRTSSFVRYGLVTCALREAKRTIWALDLVPGVANPLYGTVSMKINYEFSVNIDHKGFLTMFEDISGFGAWHRRWCRLHGNDSNNILLSYWRNPEDERKQLPIGSLDLSGCEQKIISTAPRDVCSRLNTMLLELKRPRHKHDQDSLVLITNGDHTIVRHLLSADTREERNEWIAHFTKALALMRGWSAQR